MIRRAGHLTNKGGRREKGIREAMGEEGRKGGKTGGTNLPEDSVMFLSYRAEGGKGKAGAVCTPTLDRMPAHASKCVWVCARACV